MSLHVFARIAAAALLTSGIAGSITPDLKGDYNVEFVVQGTPYVGTFKTTAGSKGAYTAKLHFTSPSVILADVTGKTAGDSVTFDAKYTDQSRGCTGTLGGKGTVEKDAVKAAGAVTINDSCSGALTGTFRLWK